MGFNGVTFQTDAGTISAVSDFAQRDRAEGYTGLAHALGMNVTLWVHELTEITPEMGPVSPANDALWTAIRDRYERVLGQIAPQIDGLVLTVSESQIWVTDPDTLNSASVLYEPSEVNLCALGALASGAVDSLDEIWNTWAGDRYGAASAAAVIAALEHSTDVVQEALYVQRLSSGDTRSFPPPNGDSDAFANNWDCGSGTRPSSPCTRRR
jgi:hypothetical protein